MFLLFLYSIVFNVGFYRYTVELNLLGGERNEKNKQILYTH